MRVHPLPSLPKYGEGIFFEEAKGCKYKPPDPIPLTIEKD
jgi:hypothetical protein